jgi:alkanesulfonate monooxygenase SsuD/methylene tetrahydromethanopterin reductase-like flavin-dependent oxidoreductase (luciferase family)
MSERESDVLIGVVTSGAPREAAQLERRALDSLWVGGHLASTNPSPEVIVGLSRLVCATERVLVGSAIVILPLYPPALLAKQIADLDRVAEGRVVLGVGVGGEYPQEFRAVGVPLAERGKRADEMIPLLRELWTARAVNHEGTFFALDDVTIQPAPWQADGPPIVVGGRRLPAMRRAATLGDGWFPYLYSPSRYASSAATITQLAAEHDRDLSGFGWFVWVFVSIEEDGDHAREVAARSLGGTYGQDLRAMIDRVAAAGTVAEVTEKLCAFYDAGARHFVFAPMVEGGDPTRLLDKLFGEVVPALKEHASNHEG